MAEEVIATEVDPKPAPIDTAIDWKASLPEDIRSDATIDSAKTVEELARMTISAQKLVSADKIAVPAKGAEQTEWDDFYGKLGRPDKSDGYQVPEGMKTEELGEGIEAWFRESSHRLGLNGQQFAGLLRDYDGFVTDSVEKQEAAANVQREEAVKTLQAEWGAATEERIAGAKSVIREHLGEEFSTFLEESGLGNDPRMIRGMAKIWRITASDEVIGGGSGTSFTLTPADAQKQIDGLMQDEAFQKVYLSDYAIGHKEAVQKMADLFKLAKPKKKDEVLG